jgi:hypothetical protein
MGTPISSKKSLRRAFLSQVVAVALAPLAAKQMPKPATGIPLPGTLWGLPTATMVITSVTQVGLCSYRVTTTYSY